MQARKEPVDISCPECNANYRLWIPDGLMPEGARGEEFRCIRCGAPFLLKKTGRGFSVWMIREEEAPKKPSSLKKEGVAKAPRVSVLAVDDDELSLGMVEDGLKDLNITLYLARNGPEALERLSAARVDLIVTDLFLRNPDDPRSTMDGEDLIKRVVESGKGMPCVVTTGKHLVDDLILDPKWVGLNVRAFIQKGSPFWADSLKAKIKELLNVD